MEKLRIRFDNDGDVDLKDVEIYSIGSLLKLFLVIDAANFYEAFNIETINYLAITLN